MPDEAAASKEGSPALCLVYGCAAGLTLAPAIALLVHALTLSYGGRVNLATVVAPVLVVPLLAGAWLSWISWRVLRSVPSVLHHLLLIERGGLVLGAALCGIGWWGLEQARLSAARGGGLLGTFGLIPLSIGALMLLLAAASWAVRRSRGNAARQRL